ncbi:HNH endonuclease [Metapseudomonas boanensis]|nr:HNH endonuclease signature motif containing protein [Pseudomonas boanensis]
MSPDEQLRALKPSQCRRIYDVVAEAGLDVSPWHVNEDGEPVEDFRTNPHYRSRWAFIDAQSGASLLCLWYDQMRVEGSLIVYAGNAQAEALAYERMGEDYRQLRGDAKKRARSDYQRGRTWARHAREMNRAIVQCYGRRASLAVAIVDRAAPKEQERERADRRELDHELWHVHSYDRDSGAYVLVRSPASATLDAVAMVSAAEPAPNAPPAPRQVPMEALPPAITTDSYGIDLDDQFIVDDRVQAEERTTSVYPRNPAHRQTVLLRSHGCCEYCLSHGFLKANGKRYLETHHIRPLADGGPDHPLNMIALCANDHRAAHHGANRAELQAAFTQIAKRQEAARSVANS